MISFIILNYKSYQDTILCIESILKIKTKIKKSIIIVDNATLNKKELKKLREYTQDIILLDENIGFAKGNNIGCRYAIEKYNSDFLCVLNSDIEIHQEDFIDKIYEIDKKYHFDVLGPKILPEELDSCNPFPAYTDIKQVKKKINYTKTLIFIYQILPLRYLLSLYLKRNRKKIHEPLKNGREVMEKVPLHCCALIFSKKYYEKYTDVFYNKTFLFHEEEFLYQRCLRDNLVFLYHPKIELLHKEGKSLDKKYKNDKYKKIIFKNKEILKSLKLLKKVMKQGREI